jgi:hypothetical protein
MSFKAGDCLAGIGVLLMNRPVAQAIVLEAIRKTVLEYTVDYKHPLLEVNGPLVALVAYQNIYDPSYFTGETDHALDVGKINSFFLYSEPYVAPSVNNLVTNAGYDLKYRSIESIEVLLNIPGTPMYWTRHNNQIYIASMPDNTYNLYMRFQTQHPYSDTVNGFTLTTVIQMADEWQEMIEYGAAMRCAQGINLSGKVTELRERLYGDTKFQTTSGIEGAPGLIFQRTSQRNRDQATTTRRMRLRMGSV